MEIMIYHPVTLELLDVITKTASAKWTRRLYEIGSFELCIPRDAKGTESCKMGYIICQGKNSGIIRYIQQTTSRDENNLRVVGQTLQGVCADRIIVPPFYYMTGTIDPIYAYDRIKDNGENVMKHYVKTQITEASDKERRMPMLQIAESLNRGIAQAAWQAKFTRLSDELAAIGKYVGLGWSVDLDISNRRMVFDVIDGIHRESSQSDVAPVIFYREMKNIESVSYTNDQTESINVVYTAGAGEEEKQYVTKNGSAAGMLRREGYNSITSEDTDEVKDGSMAYLKEGAPKETLEANANQRTEYRYDWDLGDYVTVMDEVCGNFMMLDKQVTEVEENYERGGETVRPVFGEKQESILRKLRRN